MRGHEGGLPGKHEEHDGRAKATENCNSNRLMGISAHGSKSPRRPSRFLSCTRSRSRHADPTPGMPSRAVAAFLALQQTLHALHVMLLTLRPALPQLSI